MNNNDIKTLLLEHFPEYEKKQILLNDLTQRICFLPEKYRNPLIAWLKGGEIPDFEYNLSEGKQYSVKTLCECNHFTVPSAILTLAWLEYDTENALKTLKRAGVQPMQ